MPSIPLARSRVRESDITEVASRAVAESDGTAGKSKPHVPRGERFSHTTLAGDAAVLTTCNQVHTYMFNPAHFARYDYPTTWPAGRPWPPRTIEDLCCAPDIYKDRQCNHTLKDWSTATKDWETYFKLRQTADRGIGVFANQTFEKLDILGWYAGDVAPYDINTGIYTLSLTIGETSSPETINWKSRDRNLHIEPCGEHFEEEVIIDAQLRGNWTRFINIPVPLTLYLRRAAWDRCALWLWKHSRT